MGSASRWAGLWAVITSVCLGGWDSCVLAQENLQEQMKALSGAKPSERAALAEKVIQGHVELSETLLGEGKHPAAIDALRKAKGLTMHLAGPRARQVAGQLDVRMNLAQWRQNNDGRGLRAEYFEGRKLEKKVAERVDGRIDFNWHRAAPVAGLDQEEFSARWSGVLVAPRAGTYTIVARYDGRCRAFLDEVLLFDDWEGGSGRVEVPIRLTGRPQPLRVEYYNIRRPAHLSLHWGLQEQNAGGGPLAPAPAVTAVIPPEAFFVDEKAAHRLAGKPAVPPRGFGLAAEYFEGEFTRSVLKRIDTEINFHWDRSRPANVGMSFSARWRGFIRAPKPGKYRLVAHHDDGIRVWIDENLVMNHWPNLGFHNTQLDLTGQPQAIVVEYLNQANPAYLSLQWQAVGVEANPVIIPSSALFTDQNVAQHAP